MEIERVLDLGTQIADALDAGPCRGHRPPRHQAGQHLHDRARSEGVEPLPLPLLLGWLVDLYQRVSSDLLAQALSAAFLLGGTGFSIILIERWPKLRTPATATLVACGVVAVLSGVSLVAKLRTEANRVEAVVVSENAYVRSGPLESSPRLAEIHEGLKVRVLGEREGFIQVSLANGLTGWIPEEQVETI